MGARPKARRGRARGRRVLARGRVSVATRREPRSPRRVQDIEGGGGGSARRSTRLKSVFGIDLHGFAELVRDENDIEYVGKELLEKKKQFRALADEERAWNRHCRDEGWR